MADRKHPYGPAPKDFNERIAWARAVAEFFKLEDSSAADSDEEGPGPDPGSNPPREPER